MSGIEEVDFGDIDQNESLEGFDHIVEGQYHYAIDEVDASRTKVAGLRVKLRILDGNVSGQVNKAFTETFWDPRDTDKDGGKYANKRRARLAIETGLMTKESLGQKVQINWELLKGRQLCGPVKDRKTDDGKVYSELDGLNFGSPLDPKWAHIPKQAEAMSLLGVATAPAQNGATANSQQALQAQTQPAQQQQQAPANPVPPSPPVQAPSQQADPFAALGL